MQRPTKNRESSRSGVEPPVQIEGAISVNPPGTQPDFLTAVMGEKKMANTDLLVHAINEIHSNEQRSVVAGLRTIQDCFKPVPRVASDSLLPVDAELEEVVLALLDREDPAIFRECIATILRLKEYSRSLEFAFAERLGVVLSGKNESRLLASLNALRTCSIQAASAALPQLLELIGHANEKVQHEACSALERFGKYLIPVADSLVTAISRLHDRRLQVRLVVALLAGVMGEADSTRIADAISKYLPNEKASQILRQCGERGRQVSQELGRGHDQRNRQPTPPMRLEPDHQCATIENGPMIMLSKEQFELLEILLSVYPDYTSLAEGDFRSRDIKYFPEKLRPYIESKPGKGTRIIRP